MPFVSIIIPVYNSERYLNVTINSLFNQTFQDFELILVNDGSTDTSGKLCDDFALKDERVIVIHKNKWRSKCCEKYWFRTSERRTYLVC